MPPSANRAKPPKDPLGYRMAVYGLAGMLLAGLLSAVVVGVTDSLVGKHEGNSTFVTVLVWAVMVPLMAVTLAPLWINYVHQYYVAVPWYFALRLVLPDGIAIVVGFMINGALLGAITARLTHGEA